MFAVEKNICTFVMRTNIKKSVYGVTKKNNKGRSNGESPFSFSIYTLDWYAATAPLFLIFKTYIMRIIPEDNGSLLDSEKLKEESLNLLLESYSELLRAHERPFQLVLDTLYQWQEKIAPTALNELVYVFVVNLIRKEGCEL